MKRICPAELAGPKLKPKFPPLLREGKEGEPEQRETYEIVEEMGRAREEKTLAKDAEIMKSGWRRDGNSEEASISLRPKLPLLTSPTPIIKSVQLVKR